MEEIEEHKADKKITCFFLSYFEVCLGKILSFDFYPMAFLLLV